MSHHRPQPVAKADCPTWYLSRVEDSLGFGGVNSQVLCLCSATLAAPGSLLKKVQVPREVKVAACPLHLSTGGKQLPPYLPHLHSQVWARQLQQLMSKCPTNKKTPRCTHERGQWEEGGARGSPMRLELSEEEWNRAACATAKVRLSLSTEQEPEASWSLTPKQRAVPALGISLLQRRTVSVGSSWGGQS